MIDIDSVIDHDKDEPRNHDDEFDCAEDAQDTNEVNKLQAVQAHRSNLCSDNDSTVHYHRAGRRWQ